LQQDFPAQSANRLNKVALDVSNPATGQYIVVIKAANDEKQQQKVLIERR
jgi:nitrate reductase NapAB chaperone NapD